MQNPPIPAELAEIIATHRALFGGFTMMADEQEANDADAEAGDQPDGDGQEEAIDKLGDAGLKALHQERDARKDLERQLNQLRDSLASLGGAKADPKSSLEDQISNLAAQFADLTNQTQVDKLARVHGITDEKDLELLAQAPESARDALAARLAPNAEAKQAAGKRGHFPSSDPSQGRSNAGRKRPDLKGVDRLAAAFEEADYSN